MKRIGAIELGGTKAIVGAAVMDGTARPKSIDTVRIPTTSPQETLARCADTLRDLAGRMGGLDAVGIASFGPLQLDPRRPGYGAITRTPKPGWTGAPVRDTLAGALRDLKPGGVPVAIDTDVNGAALGEGRWGAAQGLDSHVYVTVGTGIGVGVVVGGRPQHGLVHPEGGHLLVRRDPARDPYTGHCPYHGDCLEGLACGPAIEARVGRPATDLADDHPVWDLVGDYLGQMAANLLFTLSPQRIVIGGGVAARPGLLGSVRHHAHRHIGGYIDHPLVTGDLTDFIVPPGLDGESGMAGALALGWDAACSRSA
ncbi:ROK family protein [Nitrospirillum sp. BR 11828]|uniref:ROK family protein n=1 Tax=Nitrospirillum sp. BR 11828 TaxID=3104325 RepID=UPI002ACA1FEB|nr:ROK family protein [Nitrospirillum sp. BR 11828]MDZ5645588.1 ROK family protein [Nitrospirillum sp. BR 11828]